MALALALELALKDEGSHWQPYLETLPDTPDCDLPLFAFGPEEMSLCRGTYFHDMVISGREEFAMVMKEVVGPILDKLRQRPEFKHKDLGALFKRAYALQASRAFEGPGGASLILPVVDCLNGLMPGSTNASMLSCTQVRMMMSYCRVRNPPSSEKPAIPLSGQDLMICDTIPLLRAQRGRRRA
jgi:hypothetical protein